MKRNKRIVIITIFFMAVILTSIIFMQFRTARQTSLTDIENMTEEELEIEATLWKTKYDEANQKLSELKETYKEYEGLLKNNTKTDDVLKKELDSVELLSGKTDVTGEGMVITLEDNNEQQVTASALLNLVNELKYAGAEAISINENRIINISDIVDVNYVVQIEGKKLSSPYIVKCIGNQDYLESTLNAKNGYMQTYIDSGISIKMERSNNVKISKHDGDISSSYINEK